MFGRGTYFWKAAFLLWLGITVYFSLVPAGITPASGISDKWEHAIGYGIFFLLCFLAGQRAHKSFVLTCSVGIAMEIGQIFIPGRQFDLLDILANVTGALIAYILIRLILSKN